MTRRTCPVPGKELETSLKNVQLPEDVGDAVEPGFPVELDREGDSIDSAVKKILEGSDDELVFPWTKYS